MIKKEHDWIAQTISLPSLKKRLISNFYHKIDFYLSIYIYITLKKN